MSVLLAAGRRREARHGVVDDGGSTRWVAIVRVEEAESGESGGRLGCWRRVVLVLTKAAHPCDARLVVEGV